MTVVLSFTTGSRHGNVRAPGALRRLLKSKSLPTAFACAEQVHGTRLQIVPSLAQPKRFARADGLLTDAQDQPVAIFTADCVPIFLSAAGGRVIGILHAGWRGVQGRILAQAVGLLRKKWDLGPSQVVAWAGPHIRSCCFEVQWDVAKYFPATRRRFGKGGWRIDLSGELRRQARRLGIRWASKKPLEDCTMHKSGHFSYRRDKTSKRQASIMIKREKI